MDRYNAMGHEYPINDEVMCLAEEGSFILYEGRRKTPGFSHGENVNRALRYTMREQPEAPNLQELMADAYDLIEGG